MPTLRDIAEPAIPVSPGELGKHVYDRFRSEPDLLILPVVDADERPVGILERNAFFLKMAAEYGRAIYAERPIERLMDTVPLLVEAELPLAQFTTEALSDKPSELLRGFIVHDNGRYLGVGTVIALLHAANRAFVQLAHYDPLTGLPNRVLFHKQLREALARAARGGGEVAVLHIDLDRFKTVNDTLGHAVGDELLRAAAQRLRSCVREGDTVARMGGDEFAIVQTGLSSPDDAQHLAARVVETMNAPLDLHGHAVVASASVGVAVAPMDGREPDELLMKADMAMYRVKGDGRRGYRFFERAMDEVLQNRRRLELDLREALELNQFELLYQPLYDLEHERVTGCEALLRWRHPERGLVSPADFIPLAEEIGLILPMGEWVLRQACAEASRWPESVSLAVNLSPIQFRDRRLLDTVKGALDGSGLSPQRLQLEITESVLLADNAANLELLHDLRKLGVRISMDDFGTGYSSLSYLRSFPFDKIKIDQTFVRDIPRDADALAIIRAVADLGERLGIVTTAEGVETTEQFDELRRQGCREIQGYLISPPKAPAEIMAMLEAENSFARAGAA
ncbi:EAL domain-containing protein [Caulobacter segnis]|uniref:EAL domain-containing protein n=1 Tax=Caulobacter segnis TaxID=88688 RepID=UPI00240FCED3|nr:EAL domain-containing protein [Caulobacter segnis]MDG2521828.1 EAL domain-containing protein [Caulobacter segnis]